MISLNPWEGAYSIVRREELKAFFEHSPTARLLRSDTAAYVMDFLQHTFKSGGSISIGQSELRSHLTGYLEELHDSEPEILTGPSDRYVSQWVDAGWLKRFIEAASTEPQYQLTAHAEEAIQYVDAALSKRQNMVGTESRLRLIIDTLEDIVRGATADPQRRLDYLLEQRALLDSQIEAIQSGQAIQVYRPAQIRERFQTAMNLLRELQADFRAVEERFQVIARDVHQLQSAGNQSRGKILGFALDSEDLLKQQDEGISFYAFVRFLLSPAQQSALRQFVDEISVLEALKDQQDALARLRRMVPGLLAEADKVMRTTAKLSTTLRRLHDARAAAHRQRLATVLRDIRTAALQLNQQPPTDLVLEIDSEAHLTSPLTRPFWTAEAEFAESTLLEHVSTPEDLLQLAAAISRMHRLDFRKLRGRISELTLTHPCTLPVLLDHHPAGSIVDVLAYFQIAADDGHTIDPVQIDHVRLAKATKDQAAAMLLQIPRVTFLPRASRQPGGAKPR